MNIQQIPIASIYDDESDPLSHTPRAVAKVPLPLPEGFVYTEKHRRKEWSAPLVGRDKLMETLNALERENYEIFAVITANPPTIIQIVCFQYVEDKSDDA